MPDFVKRSRHVEKHARTVLFFQMKKIWRRLTYTAGALKCEGDENQIEC